MKKYTVKHQKNKNYGWEGDLLENQVAREDDAEVQGHKSVTFLLEQGTQVSRPNNQNMRTAVRVSNTNYFYTDP